MQIIALPVSFGCYFSLFPIDSNQLQNMIPLQSKSAYEELLLVSDDLLRDND